MTLMRFAQLTARMEGCASREALLAQEGVTLEEWLAGQKYWLGELTNHLSADRPRLFNHYISLLDRERQRLGKPQLGGIKQAFQPAAKKLYELQSPHQAANPNTPPPLTPTVEPRYALGRAADDQPDPGMSEIPDFLKRGLAASPTAAPPKPSGLAGCDSSPRLQEPRAPEYLPQAPAYVPPQPAYAQEPQPAYVPPQPAYALEPQPRAPDPIAYAPPAYAQEVYVPPKTYAPIDAVPQAPAPVADIPAFLLGLSPGAQPQPQAAQVCTPPPQPQLGQEDRFGDVPAYLCAARSAAQSPAIPAAAPRLPLEHYVEILYALEQAHPQYHTQYLQQCGFDAVEWEDEIRRWQTGFIGNKEIYQRFEQLIWERRNNG